MITTIYQNRENENLNFSKEERCYLSALIRTQGLKVIIYGLITLLFDLAFFYPHSLSVGSAAAAAFLPLAPLFLVLFIVGSLRLHKLLEYKKDHTAFLRQFGRSY